MRCHLSPVYSQTDGPDNDRAALLALESLSPLSALPQHINSPSLIKGDVFIKVPHLVFTLPLFHQVESDSLGGDVALPQLGHPIVSPRLF